MMKNYICPHTTIARRDHKVYAAAFMVTFNVTQSDDVIECKHAFLI